MRLFERYGQAIGSPDEEGVLGTIYEQLPVRNFSTEILQNIPKQVAVIELSGVHWSDWGKAERIVSRHFSVLGDDRRFH
jgi:mannose-1-phosphate guanylyltransferase